MKSILVPLDGSTLAEQVLAYVRLLAPLLNARARLLHVSSDEDVARVLVDDGALARELGDQLANRHTSPEQLRELLRQQAADYLAARATDLRAAGMDVEVELRDGFAPEQIVAVAEHGQAHLIAMATHGYRGLKRWTLGSVTDKVVHAATCPIFLVRATDQHQETAVALKRILVPLDGSALAEQALPLALELASRARAELLLLQAVIPLVEYAPGLSPFARSLPQSIQYPDMLCEQAQQQLTTTINRYATPELRMKSVVLIGSPAEAIVDEAVHRGVDLIVMATHGYSGLRRWALGSVADKVLHATTIPLILVRAQP